MASTRKAQVFDYLFNLVLLVLFVVAVWRFMS